MADACGSAAASCSDSRAASWSRSSRIRILRLRDRAIADTAVAAAVITAARGAGSQIAQMCEADEQTRHDLARRTVPHVRGLHTQNPGISDLKATVPRAAPSRHPASSQGPWSGPVVERPPATPPVTTVTC